MNKLIAFLQLFAQAGDSVNATATMTNAYDGTTVNRGTSNSMAPMLKDFYDTELLENYRMKRMYSQFAKKVPLPLHHNGRVEMRKWNTFARAGKLQEGVIPTGQTFGSTKITGTIDQYGTFTAFTDVLEMQAYDDVIAGATEEMGASAAETQETLIRNGLLEFGSVLYCDNIDANGAKVGQTPTSMATMGASTTDGYSTLTPTMVNKAVTILKKNKAPTINGKYVMVCHPSVLYDLRENKDWIEVHKYAATTEIFNGEVGELHGMRIIENVDAPVFKGDSIGGVTYQNKSGGAVYASYAFGKEAFGIIDPAGGNLSMIFKDKSEVGGPLEQFSTIGYKFQTGMFAIYPERMLRVMSCSSFSGDDGSNY